MEGRSRPSRNCTDWKPKRTQAAPTPPEARDDDVETYLYSRALRNAQQALAEGAPLGEHLIRTAHQQLLSFGRGARKRPAATSRTELHRGRTAGKDLLRPDIAPEQWARRWPNSSATLTKNTMRPLIRTAIAHVEFEALHPFEDGNGRIGRMLITLMLWKLGVPSAELFVSGY